MRSSLVVVAFSCLASLASLAACSSTSSTSSEATKSTSLPVGRYAFVLDESSVLARIQTSCAKEADPKACLAEIHEEAAREGIRLSIDREGHVVWTSYVLEKDGSETIDLEATIDPRWDGTRLTGEVVGSLTGTKGKTANPKMPGFVVERIDERTIAMDDPQKGRLVFRKSP